MKPSLATVIQILSLITGVLLLISDVPNLNGRTLTRLRCASRDGAGRTNSAELASRPRNEAYVYIAGGARKHFMTSLASMIATRKVDPVRPIVLLYNGPEIDSDLLPAYMHLRVDVRRVPQDVAADLSQQFDVPGRCAHWKNCWLKLYALGLAEFDSILILDGDYLLLQPVELAFDTFRPGGLARTPFDMAAVEDMVQVFGYPNGYNDYFNTGFLAARPSALLYRELVSFAASTVWVVNLADQSIINQFVQEKGNWIRLPTTYNLFPYNFHSMVLRIGSFPFPQKDKAATLDRVHGLHYAWMSKWEPGISAEECRREDDDCVQCCLLWVEAQARVPELLSKMKTAAV